MSSDRSVFQKWSWTEKYNTQNTAWPGLGIPYAIHPHLYVTENTANVEVLREKVTSYALQNPRLKAKVRVAWVPKIPLVKPIEPVLYVGTSPSLQPKRTGQSAQSYMRYLLKYRDLRDKFLIAQMRNRLRFNDRWKKYEKRLKKYEENLYALTNGIESFRMLPFCRAKDEWHPYKRERMVLLPGACKLLIESRTLFGGEYGSSITRLGEYAEGAKRWLEGTWMNTSFGITTGVRIEDQQVVDLLVQETDANALARARNRLSRQVVHLGNILAERHQTYQMFSDLLKRAAALIKGRTLVGVLSQKKTSSDFLMFQFGLRPLLSDVYAVAQELDQDVQDDTTTLRFKASSHSTRDHQYTDELLIRQVHTFVKVSYALEFEVENKSLKTLSEYGLTNPLPIAWEMMKWSFVWDWFLPIGAWLRDVSSPRATVFVRGTKTTTTRVIITSKATWLQSVAPYYPFDRWTGQAWSSTEFETKERVLLTENPLGFYVPKFKSPFSAYHIAESIALFIQRRKSS